jgi:para-aminobenzoate synthetase/4-amino-4-deoxychorismate lyase
VRAAVSKNGDLSLSTRGLPQAPQPSQVTIASGPVNSNNPLLYHKTSDRRVYQEALAGRPGFEDVLLWNERGELTESTIGNVAVEMDGKLYTPPISCGLLAGVYRGYLLERGRIKEQVIKIDDALKCSKVYLMNSVRGLWEVTISKSATTSLSP